MTLNTYGYSQSQSPPTKTVTTETVEYNEAGQVVKRTIVTETIRSDRQRYMQPDFWSQA